jgi:hypothetical protein
MLCGHFIGIDKLEHLKLLQNYSLFNVFDHSVKEPENVSRFLQTLPSKQLRLPRISILKSLINYFLKEN